MTRTRRHAVSAVVAVLALSGLAVPATAEVAASAPTSPQRPAAAEDLVVPDLARGLIIRTTSGTSSSDVAAATASALGATADVTGTASLAPSMSTVAFDRVVDGDAAAAVAARVERRADVVWAVPDRLRRASAVSPVSTDDPLFSQQRNLWDRSSSVRGGFSTKAPALWQATRGVRSTVVAVIDTGILAHPDLAGRTVAGYDFVGSATRGRDGNGRDADPTDVGDWNTSRQCGGAGATTSSWHGTFVAGQVAATADNRTGITGVAPGVVVQPVRALGRCGGWDSDLLDSIRWASGGTVRGAPVNATPAAIVNLSLGGLAANARERRATCRAYDAVAAAGRARGSIFIAAAGNEGADADLAVPASCGQYISVGAVGRKGFSASYSNIGPTVDLAAPGGDTAVGGPSDSIVSLGNAGRRRAGANRYVRYEGTSMAAPQVAGAAALLHGLGITAPDELTTALLASVSPFRPRSSAYAHRRVRYEGRTYRVDLNCTTRGRRWCGRGLLDLSRVQAPVSVPQVSGVVAVGQPVVASDVGWVSTPAAVTRTWRADGVVVGTGATYQPTSADVGRRLTVTIAPSSGPYARLAATSVPTGPVPEPDA